MKNSLTNSEIKNRLVSAIALLNVSGIGGMRYTKLVKAFGDTQGVINAPIDQIAEINGISRSQASTIKSEIDFEKAAQAAARIVQLGWSVIFLGDIEYPPSLKHISDAPPILFRLGEPLASDDKLIAMVGTRLPSESGKMFTYNLALKLAQEGITVVSGMAEGIDSAAHRGEIGRAHV